MKIDGLVFAVDELDDLGNRVTLRGRLDEGIVRKVDALRSSGFGSPRVRFVHGDRVVDAQLASLRRTTRAGTTDVTIELERAELVRPTALRAGAAGMTPDDLVEAGLRNLLLGEPLPERLGMLSHMADPGIDAQALEEAFALPDPEAAEVVRLTLAEALIGTGNASAITRFELGQRTGAARVMSLEWQEPRTYANVEPGRRRIDGEWRVAAR